MVSFVTELAELCDRAGLTAQVTEQLTRDLVEKHSEPQRHYHTVDHIEAVLRHLQTLQALTITTGFAAFFHDAIYDPTRSDNEVQSANLARSFLGVSHVVEADNVAAIIDATARHELTDGLPADAASFLDADLAILGQSPKVYGAYTLAIRAEYTHLSDDDFRTGRAAVLESFVDRPSLYFTDVGRDLWEEAARANIANEIQALRG